jgi:hypothetical protein
VKLVGIMSVQEKKAVVRDLLKERGIEIYSETDILGHTPATIAQHGWFATARETPEYSSLSFAILPDDAAEAVFAEIERLAAVDESDHPLRAFLVPVERMV